jgi:hypothetical protein
VLYYWATVNADHYDITLGHHKEANWKKWSYLLTEVMIFVPDNTHSHTTYVTMQLLRQFCSKCLAHPQYSMDVVPSHFHLSEQLINHFKGKHF